MAVKTAENKKKKPYDRVIGIDLGNGLIKVRSETSEAIPYLLTLASGYGFASSIGHDNYSTNKAAVELDVFNIRDNEYVWGEDVTKLDEFVTTFGYNNRYKSEAYKTMAQIVLSKVVYDLEIEENEKILVVTGVPSEESGTSAEEGIVEAFLGDTGKHQSTINGETKKYHVAGVEVVAQPVATVLGRYLDEDGFVENESYESMKVAVVDIGAGTTDLDIVDSLSRTNNYTSIKHGFKEIYNTVRTEVIEKQFLGHKVSDYRLFKSLNTKKYRPSMRYEAVDFADVYDKAVHVVATHVQQAILDTWDDQQDIDELLIVGGGVDEFQPYLSSIMEGMTVPENHSNSNVEGYFRYGKAIREGLVTA
ncbi:hypothetical protein [Bacillus sp. Marseille-P3800]|uniref:ParM/StbA family protein n=1 Tax=Bacillus sp. Marseille-P3800 TaxID=2014782 RepID=UPI000C07912A|nr:hypothetical protein [Bacillus sp. Marseille-P3800]